MQYARLCYNDGFGNIWYWVVFPNTTIFNQVLETELPFRWYVEKHQASTISNEKKREIQQSHNFSDVNSLLGFIQRVENYWEEARNSYPNAV